MCFKVFFVTRCYQSFLIRFNTKFPSVIFHVIVAYWATNKIFIILFWTLLSWRAICFVSFWVSSFRTLYRRSCWIWTVMSFWTKLISTWTRLVLVTTRFYFLARDAWRAGGFFLVIGPNRTLNRFFKRVWTIISIWTVIIRRLTWTNLVTTWGNFFTFYRIRTM